MHQVTVARPFRSSVLMLPEILITIIEKDFKEYKAAKEAGVSWDGIYRINQRK